MPNNVKYVLKIAYYGNGNVHFCRPAVTNYEDQTFVGFKISDNYFSHSLKIPNDTLADDVFQIQVVKNGRFLKGLNYYVDLGYTSYIHRTEAVKWGRVFTEEYAVNMEDGYYVDFYTRREE